MKAVERGSLREMGQCLVLVRCGCTSRCKEKRLVTTSGHYAYMKIAEGCDKHCTYCIIPKLRGNYRSVPMEKLLAEAKDLADQGVKS